MANATAATAGAVGTVVSITGPVVDIEVAARELPAIYNAVRIDRAGDSLVVEVQQHARAHLTIHIMTTMKMRKAMVPATDIATMSQV